MTRKPDPFEGAPCRSEEHTTWMRANRASKFDFRIDGEDDTRRNKRHHEMLRECRKCPATAHTACRELHDQLAATSESRVPGIWGGKVYADRTECEPIGDDNALIRRDELAA
ncbi:hypothetical protein [Nocardia ignorata]|uniref:4Fe-4S Wbl-type domain-containing protein n=1 Tax=Nocardia ignorata TaxID=145285 RepID=A0A4R6NZP7_NOCIG|nr:hypothetical protein [Nocardia ignorata]TDP29818.1 hypothetical protein DFR75_11286 [Nocardia ignorata]